MHIKYCILRGGGPLYSKLYICMPFTCMLSNYYSHFLFAFGKMNIKRNWKQSKSWNISRFIFHLDLWITVKIHHSLAQQPAMHYLPADIRYAKTCSYLHKLLNISQLQQLLFNIFIAELRTGIEWCIMKFSFVSPDSYCIFCVFSTVAAISSSFNWYSQSTTTGYLSLIICIIHSWLHVKMMRNFTF